jgi:hypothetical protein
MPTAVNSLYFFASAPSSYAASCMSRKAAYTFDFNATSRACDFLRVLAISSSLSVRGFYALRASDATGAPGKRSRVPSRLNEVRTCEEKQAHNLPSASVNCYGCFLLLPAQHVPHPDRPAARRVVNREGHPVLARAA